MPTLPTLWPICVAAAATRRPNRRPIRGIARRRRIRRRRWSAAIFRGGPKGIVRTADGKSARRHHGAADRANAVRTTVYSNQDGQYEFPQLAPGSFTLRIARPLEFLPYQREAVRVGGGLELDDIVLQRRSDTDLLPPTDDVLSQLTGAEWLWNLPGNRRGKAYLQPHLREAATATTRSCATGSTSAAGG